MTYPAYPSSVPLFHSLESGTVEQDQQLWNTEWNVCGTTGLKALATKVLERNKEWNKDGTEASKSVPPMPPCSTGCGTKDEGGCKAETECLVYDFEERLAIAEYDGGQISVDAHGIAYLDAFLTILFELSARDPQKDLLAQKIQIAIADLEAQGLHTIN